MRKVQDILYRCKLEMTDIREQPGILRNLGLFELIRADLSVMELLLTSCLAEQKNAIAVYLEATDKSILPVDLLENKNQISSE